MLISIVTPTYNNSKGVQDIFQCLLKQSDFDFEWIIVDDGSSEAERKKLQTITSEIAPFKIRLFHQSNQGKHIALNLAFSKINGAITIIIDSDDKPLSNMVSIIRKSWRDEYLSDKKVAFLTFERGKTENTPLIQLPNSNEVRANYVAYRDEHFLYGDLAETYKSSILKKYTFPKFKNEKFLNEGYVWNDMGRKYDSIFIPKILYISVYRSQGLTKNIRRLEWSNSIGTYETLKKEINNKHIVFRYRFKTMVKYCLFGLKNKKRLRELFHFVDHKVLFVLAFPIACFFYVFYDVKFSKKVLKL